MVEAVLGTVVTVDTEEEVEEVAAMATRVAVVDTEAEDTTTTMAVGAEETMEEVGLIFNTNQIPKLQLHSSS